MATADADPVSALVALEEFTKQYDGTDVGGQAKSSIASLKKRPEVKKAESEIAARRKAMELLGKAEEKIAKEDYADGLKALDEIAARHAGTPLGEKAKTRAAELRSDKKIATAEREQLAERYCRGRLSMGKSFAASGNPDLARAKFQEILDKFPGTSWAEKAQAELDKLK
jgi:outer membrane protein assembly factor BamD (BamD/ComL family)